MARLRKNKIRPYLHKLSLFTQYMLEIDNEVPTVRVKTEQARVDKMMMEKLWASGTLNNPVRKAKWK